MKKTVRIIALGSAALMLVACGGNQKAEEPVGPRPGPVKKYDPNQESLFGEDGASLAAVFGGG
ncbi:MAG: hypothetical protein AAFN50_14665, partial [Pseudomonadota bacterium]